MPGKLREYTGARITVTYDARRCIHAEECVHGLPEVFDPGRRVWVDPSRGEPGEIATVVSRCPTGALHFTCADGDLAERVPDRNEACVRPDGPLYLRGQLEIQTPGGLIHETRAALCRCGASGNKPFCDGSHAKVGFRDAGAITKREDLRVVSGQREDARVAPGRHDDAALVASGPLRVLPQTGGPCVIEGAFTVASADHSSSVGCGPRTPLCRCGHSAHKPFCDGSHEAAGFQG